MKNTFGSALGLTIFGESHGAGVGAVLDGMAAGVPVDQAALAALMDKRRARGDGLSTARVEADEIRILSGVVDGHTTGTPITLLIENHNTRSADYAATAALLRPGHADYTAYARYRGFQDARGGGHFSGRITAGLVAGGGVVLGALERAGVRIATHIARCAGLADTPFAQDDPAALAAQLDVLAARGAGFALLDQSAEAPMQAAIRAAGSEGDSVGGILETAILGLPAGVGEPFFDSVESVLAHMAFSVPAVKGIEFGAGFGFADLRGSQANDPLRIRDGHIYTETNRNAGINGGLANGMPVVYRTVVKPTPSIYKEQRTVDYKAGENASLSIKGRHDPCIVPRAAVVQTCAAALAVGDLLTARYGEGWMVRPELGHSYSKIIHERLCGYEYELHPLPTEAEARRFLEERPFRAINVTIPYKRLVMEYCDEIDPRAAAIGAVNTVVNRDGKLYGWNTPSVPQPRGGVCGPHRPDPGHRRHPQHGRRRGAGRGRSPRADCQPPPRPGQGLDLLRGGGPVGGAGRHQHHPGGDVPRCGAVPSGCGRHAGAGSGGGRGV